MFTASVQLLRVTSEASLESENASISHLMRFANLSSKSALSRRSASKGPEEEKIADDYFPILRIDVSSLPYHVPSSNPFGNEIWAYGLRNPWRFSFDRITGDLIIGDVGQGSFEEVDFQPATSIGGENYGWRIMEGLHCFNPTTCSQTGLVLPVLEYSHAGGACSITGGYRYRGARFPRMSGIYFYGDYCTGTIFGGTQQSNGSWTSRTLLTTQLSISTFGEDQNGEIYVADLAGTVYQITDALALQQRRRAVKK